ncbi:MAG: hypothetical protein QW330_01360 [Nitrososphaerota archaeon]
MLADSQGLRSVDVHFFSSLYEVLRKGELVEFKPSIRQGVGVVYELFGIEVPEEKIRVYHERGLMEVAREVSFPSCAVCGTTCLHIALKCPRCFSRNIEKRELMIHYDCGYTGSVEEFAQTSPGNYRCPKCGKEMKRVGIDYGRPGLGFVCGDCKMVFQIPVIEVECENGHVNRIQQLEVKKYPVYRLSEEAKKLSQVFDAVETIAQRLKALGLDAATFARVRGVSGITYNVPIYVKGDQSLVIEIAPEQIADELYPIIMSLKAADIPNSMMIIVLPSSFRPELEMIFNPEKIRVIKVEEIRESVDRIVDEIARIIGATGHADP